MRRRRREDTEGMRREEEGGEGRNSRSVDQTQSEEVFRIRLSLPSWSMRSLLVGVVLMMMMGGGVEGLQCQCSRSTESAHCSRELCDIKEREGRVPACVFVRDGPHQHYACIRVDEEKEMGCRVMRGKEGEHKVACMCRDADMCNVDLADRVDDGGDNQRILKVPAELIGEPSVVRVKAEERREGRRHDVLLEPDRDDTLGVAPSVVDFFDEENEYGVGRGGKEGRGGGLIQRERESWSDEEEKRGPSSSYRVVQGVDNRQLVPLTVKRLGEERRSKLEENIIDLTNPNYRRPEPASPPRAPPSVYQTTRRPDWRQSGRQPEPRGPYEAVRDEWEEKRRRQEMEQRVHRVQLTTRSRLPAPPPSTTTPLPPPPPSRPPTPFSIGHINTFVERPSSDPVPYPRQRWDDRPNPVPTTTTTTTEATTVTTTTPPTRRSYSVSVSRYVVSTTTVPTTVSTTTTSTTTTTTEPPTTTTSTTLAPTIPTTTRATTTITAPPTTTVRSTVAPTTTTTTVAYDDMDGGEEEYDDVVLPAGMKSNTVPRVEEKEPDSGTINTIWTTVVVTAILIGALW